MKVRVLCETWHELDIPHEILMCGTDIIVQEVYNKLPNCLDVKEITSPITGKNYFKDRGEWQ